MSSNLAFRKQTEGVKTGGFDISQNTLLLSSNLLNKYYYGDCLKLRRSSDNAQKDFGFDNKGNIDTIAIGVWGGVDTLYIVTWYDQSGYKNHANQTNHANQPTWDNVNKKIVFTALNSTYLIVTDSMSLNVDSVDFSYISNIEFSSLPTSHMFMKGTFASPRNYIRLYYIGGALTFGVEDIAAPEQAVAHSTPSLSTEYNYACIREQTIDNARIQSYTNGILDNTLLIGANYGSLTNTSDLYIGANTNPAEYLDAKVKYFMLFKKALSRGELMLLQNISSDNLNVVETTKECYDIFAQNGGLAKSNGLDSQLLVSLFVDSRADDSEQPIKELQRGWTGNIIVNNILDYEIGCKQWIYTEQGKLSTETAEPTLDTVKNDGVQWMIDDNWCQDIDVEIIETNFKEGKLILEFRFIIDQNNIEKRRIILWTNTEFK